MLRRYIEHRERTLHGRDNNRKSLPFEWGVDHVGIIPHGSPEKLLREYADHALNNSNWFYTHSPTSQYEFDGKLLKFPSGVDTPYPENNTVWGRYFDGGRDFAVIVLPQWNCHWNGQTGLCRALQRAGISALRLSMPYHHFRKPVETERAEYLISPNIGRTLAAARQSVLDARRAADWLFERGHRRIGLVGASIGSCMAFLTFVHDERFSTGVFIHVSSFFADVVWNGLSTKHVRRSLETSIGLDSLRRLWMPISPFPFVTRVAHTNRRMLVMSARYDLTFPPELSKHLHEELDKWAVPHELAWLPCGHYTLGRFPFNVMAGYRIVNFLRSGRT